MEFQKFSDLVLLVVWSLTVAANGVSMAVAETGPTAPCLVLVTLDTTRRDAVGTYGDHSTVTPTLDSLAADGVRYLRAVASSPLTLPSHATLLTGLDPPEHGVRSNGSETLPMGVQTLAEVLAGQGYSTAAFVGSRVLDRRFGLDQGFHTYDDVTVAERVGEYGYPERTADMVTAAALAWLVGQPKGGPWFLWVHYYDPHAPYEPPADLGGTTVRADYLGEVAFVDRQLGRLLRGIRAVAPEAVFAVVGDHGESLGDHGERTHGIFLYSATIEVPLLIAGSGVPTGRVFDQPVATRRLPATLLRLLGVEQEGMLPGPVLPGFDGEKESPIPIYSEAMMPSTVYGWSPLHSVTLGRWRLIDAPRPELYDLVSDPGEARNLIVDGAEEAARLQPILDGLIARPPVNDASPVTLDSETRAALRSLGYLEGADNFANDGIDPKDGVALLASFDKARALLAAGQSDRAMVLLEDLVMRNPSNVPFLSRLAQAQLAEGRGDEAVATLGQTLELASESVFVNLALADTFRRIGRVEEARLAYRTTLGIDPRWAPAWLGLAELSESTEGRRSILTEAEAAGAGSLEVLLQLARLEADAGHTETAAELLDRAEVLEPTAAATHLERARLLEAGGQNDEALASCATAADLEPANPLTALCTGRVYLALGEPRRARPHLRRAAVLGKGTDVEQEASRLLESSAQD